MNILIWTFPDWNRDVFKQLINLIDEKYGVENAIIVYQNDQVQKLSDSSYGFNNLTISSLCNEGPRYSGYKFYDECLPVDEELLRAMEPYECEFMKMLDRRNQRTYEERWCIYLEHLRYWNTALDRWKIDCYIHHLIPHAEADYVVYGLCQVKKIKFVGVAGQIFMNSIFLLTDIYRQADELKKEVSKIKKEVNNHDSVLTGGAREIYEQFVVHKENKFIRPDAKNSVEYISEPFSLRTMLKGRMRIVGSLLKNCFSTDIKCFQRMRALNNSNVFREKEILREYYEKNTSNIDKADKYILVPLNYQPEMTSSPSGGRYADIPLYVELLSYYLPEGWWLYVKEHPMIDAALSYYTNSRSDIFYNRLLKLKNVKLISIKENNFDLIENAQAISIILGTAGIEGYFRKKPILFWGHGLLEAAPKVYTIRNREDCQHAIQKITLGQDKITDDDIKIFLKALYSCRYTINGAVYSDLVDSNQLSEEDRIDQMANGYFEVIKELFPDNEAFNN